MHAHPCWQLELVISGRVSIDVAGAGFRLGPGAGLLIPPGRAHRLVYHDDTRYLSVKFTLAQGGQLDELPTSDGAIAAMIATLHRLLPAAGEPPPPRALAIGHLLAALVALRGVATMAPGADPLVTRIAELVDHGLDPGLTVAALARRCGCPASRLSARFRQATGQALKSWLDQRRAETAANLLAYSGQNLTAIAATLAFPDLFAFSRFFKRVSGQSPRDYRRGLGQLQVDC